MSMPCGPHEPQGKRFHLVHETEVHGLAGVQQKCMGSIRNLSVAEAQSHCATRAKAEEAQASALCAAAPVYVAMQVIVAMHLLAAVQVLVAV